MKILFIHQGPHKVHGAFASGVTNEWQYYGNDRRSIIKIFLKSIIFDNKKFDVILSEGGSGLPLAVLKKIKNPRTKIILLNADKFFYLISRTNPFKKALMKFFLSFVDYIIAVSEMNKRFASEYFNIQNISVVNPFGVNVNFNISCPLDTSNLMFIGDRRVSDKRFDNLVEALKILNRDNRGFQLYLIGSCADVINENYEWLHKIGYTQHLEEYFSKCSIYVHPADFDPCPVSVFEAMSVGMIPIITEYTGQSTILREYNLDFLIIEDNEPLTIAKKIREIYNMPLREKEKISLELKHISSIFSKEKQVKKFKKAFKHALQKIYRNSFKG
ncbi:MAG: glycosyltransferase family 4 protein [Methanothermobacter sp.]|nr:glycosyltransferase family 4 protein [Methanothermobacter sp.]